MIEIIKAPSLDPLAAQINRSFELAKQADERAGSHRVAAGRVLLQAKEKVAELKGDWRKWIEANIKRSYRDCNRVMALAGSENPEAAAEQERASAAAAMRESRIRAKANISPAIQKAKLLQSPAAWTDHFNRYHEMTDRQRATFRWYALLSHGKQQRFLEILMAERNAA